MKPQYTVPVGWKWRRDYHWHLLPIIGVQIESCGNFKDVTIFLCFFTVTFTKCQVFRADADRKDEE